jgi:hypothetical protein
MWLHFVCQRCQREAEVRKGVGAGFRQALQGDYKTLRPLFCDLWRSLRLHFVCQCSQRDAKLFESIWANSIWA